MSTIRHQLLFIGDAECIDQIFKTILPDTEFHYQDLAPMPKELEIENGQRLDFALDVVLSALNPENSLRLPPLPKLPQPLFNELYETLEKTANYGPYFKDLSAHDLIDFLLCEDSTQVVSLGLQALCNLAVYGHTDWYSWCEEHWGTYRDTLRSRMQSEKHLITFDTDEPDFFSVNRLYPPFELLSARFPGVLLVHLETSLCPGCRTGISKYLSGKRSGGYYPKDGTEDALTISSYLLDFDAYAEDHSAGK